MAVHKSRWLRPDGPGENQRASAASLCPASRNASTTSSPTSPQQGPRHGPIAAVEIAGTGPELELQGVNGSGGGTLHGPPPAGVRCRHGPPAAVGNQHRGTVGDADREGARRVVGGQNVRVRPAPGLGAIPPPDPDVGAVDLADEQQVAPLDADFPGDRLPLRLVLPQRQIGGGEEMVGQILERPAAQHPSPRRLRPFETAARLG